MRWCRRGYRPIGNRRRWREDSMEDRSIYRGFLRREIGRR
jgi:hypothetical protein